MPGPARAESRGPAARMADINFLRPNDDTISGFIDYGYEGMKLGDLEKYTR